MIDPAMAQALGFDSIPSREDLISQVSAADPRVGMILRVWESQRVVAESAGVDAEPGQPAQAPNHREARLRRLLRDARADLEDAEDFLAELAAALGACPRCWGYDRLCAECNGRGRPGHARPDDSLFKRWVEPAIRRMRAPAGASTNQTKETSE